MSGMIWSALGQAVANAGSSAAGMMMKGIDEERQMSFRERLMQLEEEKQRRLAQLQADIAIETEKRKLSEVEPMARDAAVQRTKAVGGAETEVLTGRQDALRPGIIQTARDTATAQQEVQREGEAAYAKPEGAEALKGIQVRAAASETPGQKAARELAGVQINAAKFEFAQKKALGELRTTLANTADPDQRSSLQQQIQDLSGASTKSYADMVTAGDSFRKLAANLRQQLKDDVTLGEEEQKEIKQRIDLYERQAASILGTTVDRRLGGGAQTPKPGAAPAAPAKPWERPWSQPAPR